MAKDAVISLLIREMNQVVKVHLRIFYIIVTICSPSGSVMWTHFGYFLINGTTLHFRVESGTCIILSIYELNYEKVDD